MVEPTQAIAKAAAAYSDMARGKPKVGMGDQADGKDFSDLAGTTYETVVRVLSDLDKEKIIRLEEKTIRILNEKALNDLAV